MQHQNQKPLPPSRWQSLIPEKNRNKTRNIKADTRNRNTNHCQEKNYVIAKLQIPEGANVFSYTKDVRVALDSKSDLPELFKRLLGDASLELNHRYEFILHQKDTGTSIPSHNYSILRSMLRKNNLPGWLDWLHGEHGWIVECEKLPYLDKHRELHEAYDIRVRELLSHFKKEKPDVYDSLKVLYYKQDPVTQKRGGKPQVGKRLNTQTLWKKVSKNHFLQDAVGNIRPFLEVILHFCTHRKEGWRTLPWLTLSIDKSQERIDRLKRYALGLMRSSEKGPDAPVQWAHHSPINHYPRSVVTPSTMTEVVIGIANILSYLFLPSPVTEVSDLKGVDRFLSIFKKPEDSEETLIMNMTVLSIGN